MKAIKALNEIKDELDKANDDYKILVEHTSNNTFAYSKLVKEIETIGKTFDPELHEAVASVVDENLGEKEIKEEYRKGYILGNKVIRHSMVVVAN